MKVRVTIQRVGSDDRVDLRPVENEVEIIAMQEAWAAGAKAANARGWRMYQIDRTVRHLCVIDEGLRAGKVSSVEAN